MLINTANLDALRVGFKTSFQRGLDQAESQYQRVATVVPSSAKEEKYGWLGKLPSVRQWIGDRHVQNLMEHDYAIKNLSFELTIGVDRDDIEDDTLGVYTPIFEEFGDSVAAWPDELVFGLLKDGFEKEGYDGQPFFDTDHPVLDRDGKPVSASNTGGGSGTPWFLLATNRRLRPLIWQLRKPGMFVALDDPTDQNVFNRKEFQYGWDGRGNVGFGFWQMAYGSRQTLNPTNYEAARTALLEMKGDFGRPLRIVPNLLVVPPSLEGAAREIVRSALVNGGETNKWAGTAEVLVSPWLA